jgi:hypothetical protein
VVAAQREKPRMSFRSLVVVLERVPEARKAVRRRQAEGCDTGSGNMAYPPA